MTSYGILLEALKEIAAMTTPDSIGVWSVYDREECLNTINAVALAAIAEFERRRI